MKKILLVIIAIILSNCEISPRKAEAQTAYKLDEYMIGYREINGMKYAIFVPGDRTIYTGAAVVNVTKDELEVELLKLQIAKLMNEKEASK